MSSVDITISGGSASQANLDPRHYDANWRRIWAATNSRSNPSDQMPTDTPAKKSLAIAAYTQEMALAGLLLSQSQGTQMNPSIIDNSRKALESIYAQAGFPEPQATRKTVETQLAGRLFEQGQAVQTGIA
jgi:hypothetical protein